MPPLMSRSALDMTYCDTRKAYAFLNASPRVGLDYHFGKNSAVQAHRTFTFVFSVYYSFAFFGLLFRKLPTPTTE